MHIADIVVELCERLGETMTLYEIMLPPEIVQRSLHIEFLPRMICS